LIRAKNSQEFYLIVQDNFFDQDKANILIEAISKSRLKNI